MQAAAKRRGKRPLLDFSPSEAAPEVDSQVGHKNLAREIEDQVQIVAREAFGGGKKVDPKETTKRQRLAVQRFLTDRLGGDPASAKGPEAPVHLTGDDKLEIDKVGFEKAKAAEKKPEKPKTGEKRPEKALIVGKKMADKRSTKAEKATTTLEDEKDDATKEVIRRAQQVVPKDYLQPSVELREGPGGSHKSVITIPG